MAKIAATSLILYSFLSTTISALPGVKSSLPVSCRSAESTPLPPSQDPWYTAPDGYENTTPGTVLRVRDNPSTSALVPNSSAAYNILYRTTDSNYQPSWAVTTLLIPAVLSNTTHNFTGGVAPGSLLNFELAYDSASVDMSPSYTFYTGRLDPSIPTALGLGWYVNVADYEGPLASFASGIQSGHATIDSTRAALDPRFGISSDAKYAIWGYSGGALAGEFAAELQEQYAPEMQFAGVALGGLTPNSNFTNFIAINNEGPEVSLLINAILGLASQDAAAEEYIKSQLKTTGPYNATGFFAARMQNTTVDSVQYADQNLFDYFVNGSATFDDPVIQSMVDNYAVMGSHGVPQMPVFAYKAINDELSPVAETDALVQTYCNAGSNILYQRNTIGGHLAEYNNGHDDALAFITAVLDGSYSELYNTSGCTIQNVTIAINTSPE
ncbi:putative Triacylglycerol lipase [Seiridium cardinale]|uniref:Triacylglycerol lipase n=1 Tax=Seiridium cardinale TaxID=138064 RepID=A0ABR2XE46_9PEZI